MTIMKDLEKLQKTELEILDEFVRVCEELKLSYFFECGSVLGAVRHGGFIPWDDDIDVGMMREDYDVFLQKARPLLKEKFYLQSDGLFAKLRNKNTHFDDGTTGECNGIFIDIFPHDLLPDDEKLRASVIHKVQKLRWLHIMQTTHKRVVHPGRDLKWRMREAGLRVAHPLLSVFPKGYFKKKMEEAARRWNTPQSHWLTCHYDADPINMRAEDFFPLKKVPFCGKEYYIMKDHDQYLTQVYGDYMQLPPEDKRITHLPKHISFEDEDPAAKNAE